MHLSIEKHVISCVPDIAIYDLAIKYKHSHCKLAPTIAPMQLRVLGGSTNLDGHGYLL